MDDMGTVLVTGTLLALYFVPGIVAQNRKCIHADGILVLNIFLGWTLIGWVVAFVWAVSDKERTPTSAQLQTRSCPFCAEQIQPAAVVCKHCGRDVPAVEVAPPWPKAEPEPGSLAAFRKGNNERLQPAKKDLRAL